MSTYEEEQPEVQLEPVSRWPALERCDSVFGATEPKGDRHEEEHATTYGGSGAPLRRRRQMM